MDQGGPTEANHGRSDMNRKVFLYLVLTLRRAAHRFTPTGLS